MVLLSQPHEFQFYAPSGDRLALCAHAALGAAYCVDKYHTANKKVKNQPVKFVTPDEPNQPQTVLIQDDDYAELQLQSVPYHETSLPLVHAEALLDQVGLDITDAAGLPMHISLAGRPKTVIPLRSVETLHLATNPASPQQFFSTLWAAQDSSGLYLYAKTDDPKVLESRQFPRNSGYPEDPATGIAAAGLAVHLHRNKKLLHSSCVVRQGWAMGRPSSIRISQVQGPATDIVSLSCGGRVEIDDYQEIEIKV
jgi:PhzF family phenazine biosynthesis protein